MTVQRHRAGRPYRRARAAMFAMYGTTCHICGHHDAHEADHLTPVSLDPHQPLDPHTMRPAHGPNSPCPVCGRLCNAERGNKPLTGAPLRTSQDW
jgi:5-methylcytosine-specific restriction endonuclease McrA